MALTSLEIVSAELKSPRPANGLNFGFPAKFAMQKSRRDFPYP